MAKLLRVLLLGWGVVSTLAMLGCTFAMRYPWEGAPNTSITKPSPAPDPTPTPLDPNAILLEHLRMTHPSPSPSPDVQAVPSPAVSSRPLEDR